MKPILTSLLMKPILTSLFICVLLNSFLVAGGTIASQYGARPTGTNGLVFQEIPWQEKGPAAKITTEDKSRGFQMFVRDEPGFVRPNAFPHDEEITSIVQGEASPGLVSTEFFALYPLKAIPNAVLSIGDLQSDAGAKIPQECIELLESGAWPQRTDWNAKTYIIAPELLEKHEAISLQPNIPALFAIRVSIPKDAAPGLYRATLNMNGKHFGDLELTVDDFELPEVPGITFGLYSDGSRWTERNFTDEEILREMKDFRQHGMNALMIYPFYGADIALKDGEFIVNLHFLRRQMRLYMQSGFNGVTVISFQMAGEFLRRVLGKDASSTSPEYIRGFKCLLEAVRKIAQEDNWPQYCIHTVDEPSKDSHASEAVNTLSIVKEMGFKTFNTCYLDFVRSHLGKYLDYRCFNNLAFTTSKTREMNDAVRQETLNDGAQFWWYGTGCYTNHGLMQDCNIYSNRHMLGVFNWRSGATGAWTWTFLRAKGNVYDDFDGNDQFEAKEACICYPTPSGNDLIHTLQWEALREGIYDYRYLALWDSLCKKTTPEKAAQSRAIINAALDNIPWTCLDYAVSNAQLRNLRKLLIQEIKGIGSTSDRQN